MPRPPASAAPLDGNALRSRRTRERILAAGLALFNAEGEAHVAMGAIAAEAGISPGNLYYHFRSKEALVLELFARFDARVDVGPLSPAAGGEAVEDLWLYLHLLLEAIGDYRFLFRGLHDLAARDPKLRARVGTMLGRAETTVVALCQRLTRSGHLRARPEELRALARNVILVATYWPSFESLRPGARAGDTMDPGRGAYQVMSLLAPFLVGPARAHLERLGRDYID